MTFDPGNSSDSLHKGFRALESLNEEGLAPGTGFQIHAHKDIEVVTYVQQGNLIHQDGAGKASLLGAGEFQRRTARRGARHSLINRSRFDRARVFQSCIASKQEDSDLLQEQRLFPMAERVGLLRLVASSAGGKASLRVHQDVQIFSSIVHAGNHLIHELGVGRGAWLHVVDGRILLVDQSLLSGDGAGLAGEAAVSFTAKEASEILLFDLA